MRNLKKFFAVVLVVALMITSMATAFAAPASTGATEAADLKELGLYDGVGYSLTDSVKRFESMVMLGKILGIEEAAEAEYATVAAAKTELAAKFTDTAALPDWSVKVLAYEVKTGMVQGGDGKLNPMGVINAAGFATMIARNVLADETIEPEDALALLAEAKAFTAAQVAQFATNTNLTRGVLVQVAYSSLKAEDADGVTVIAKLAENNEELAAIAEEQGLIVPITIVSVADPAAKTIVAGEALTLPETVTATYSDDSTAEVAVTWDKAADNTTTTTYTGTVEGTDDTATYTVTVNALALAVESVTAINLKEINVTFNKDVDATSAKLASNYTLSAGGPVLAATLSGRTVTLKLTANNTAQQTSIDVTVANVKDAAGTAITTVKKSVQMLDTTVPSVTSVVVTGLKNIEVTVSEPFLTAPSFKLDNNTYYIAFGPLTPFVAGDKVFKLETGINIPEGSHTLEVSGVAGAGTDHAGYALPKTTQTITYTKDLTAPTVTLDSATQATAKIKFSKAVSLKGAVNTADVTAYVDYNNVAQYQATITNALATYSDTYTINFAFPLSAGAHTLYLNAAANKFEDKWSNDVASTTFALNILVDSTKPAVSSVAVTNDKKFVVKFSEDVVKVDAENKLNYTLKNAAGTIITNSATYPDIDSSGHFGPTATLAYDSTTTSLTITLGTALPGASYYLDIANVKDLAPVSVNTMDAATVGFAVSDLTAPTVSSAIVNTTGTLGSKIRVTFNEAMSPDGLTTASNYRLIVNNSLTSDPLPPNSTVTIVDSKTVEIVLGTANANIDGALAPNNDGIWVSGNVKDASGNALGGFFGATAITTDGINVATGAKAKAISKNTITFNVDKELSAINIALITYTTTAPATTNVATAYYTNASGSSTVTIVLPADTTTDLSTFARIDLGAGALTNVFGTTSGAIILDKGQNALGFNQPAVADKVIADKISPAVSSVATASTTTMNVTFSEAVNPATVSIYTFTVAGNTVTGATLTAPNVLRLTLGTAISTDAKPALTQALDIKDVAGNILVAGTSVAATADGIAPIVVTKINNVADNSASETIAASSSKIIVFSEVISDASKTAVQTAITTGATGVLPAELTYAWSGATLTVSNINTTTAATFNADVMANIADSAANTTVNAGLINVTTPTVATKIAVAGAVAASGTHTLVFSEALNAASLAAVKAAVDAAYTIGVGVNTTNDGTSVVSAWGVDNKTLTVTIVIAAGDDTVTLGAIADQAVTDLIGNTSAALDVQL